MATINSTSVWVPAVSVLIIWAIKLGPSLSVSLILIISSAVSLCLLMDILHCLGEVRGGVTAGVGGWKGCSNSLITFVVCQKKLCILTSLQHILFDGHGIC